MMKKIILAIGLMFGGVALVNAQEQQQDTTQTQQSDQYRTDSTSTDDTQNQTPTQSDTSATEQSDMYRTETDSTSTGTEATTTTPPTTDDQATPAQTVTPEDQDQEGEKIEVSELPAAVQTKLQSSDYQGWVVASARKKMWTDPSDPQATAKEVYVIEAKNGAETKKLKFDKDGNEIEHDKKKDDQK